MSNKSIKKLIVCCSLLVVFLTSSNLVRAEENSQALSEIKEKIAARIEERKEMLEDLADCIDDAENIKELRQCAREYQNVRQNSWGKVGILFKELK